MKTDGCTQLISKHDRRTGQRGHGLWPHGGGISSLAILGAAISALPCASASSAQESALPPLRIQFDPSADPTKSPVEILPPPAMESWAWHSMPDGVVYPSYLAGVKEPRMATTCNYNKGTGWTWDSSLGARVGLLRYGTEGCGRPDGCELGAEGAAFPRLDLENDRILESIDFRFGVPLTFGFDRYQTKVAYYHSCSHLGDQYMLLFPGMERTNYTRDAIVWGNSYYLTDDLRVYAEVLMGIPYVGRGQTLGVPVRRGV